MEGHSGGRIPVELYGRTLRGSYTSGTLWKDTQGVVYQWNFMEGHSGGRTPVELYGRTLRGRTPVSTALGDDIKA